MTSPSKTPIVDMACEGLALVELAQKMLKREQKATERLVTPLDLK